MVAKKRYKTIGLVFYIVVLITGLSQHPAYAEPTATILITEVYDNTHTSVQDEYIALHNPTTTSVDITGWYITDEPEKPQSQQAKIQFLDHTVLSPNATLYLTQNATAYLHETGKLPTYEYKVNSRPDVPQLKIYKTVTLNNAGGLVALKNNQNQTIDLVIYGETQQTNTEWNGSPIPSSGTGVILKRNTINGQPVDTNSASDWIHPRIYAIGQSDFPAQTLTSTGELTLFVSPDNSYETIAGELRNAHHTIDMNMYEFTNPFLCKELTNALKRNITIRLFMEGSPIGGLTPQEKYILNTIASQGGNIRFIVSDSEQHINARYQFDHAKYLIIDNETVIVESCNWAKTGVPKNPTYGNREWGIVVHNPDVAAVFSEVFQDDWNPTHSDSYSLQDMNMIVPSGITLDNTIPTGRYKPRFTAQTITEPYTITPLFSPDNSEQGILNAIDSATTSLYIQQLYIYKNWGTTISPFVQHIVNKTQHGVDVKIILDYNPSYEGTTAILNETKTYLETYGAQVKFLSPGPSPFTTVHNKGMIIDNQTVLISSINWNEQSVRKNREAGILLTNHDAASYYAAVFLSDWNLDLHQPTTTGFSWADYKYYVLIAVVFTITLMLIIRDWRKRKWS
jgi:cardiolipin synthase A/B